MPTFRCMAGDVRVGTSGFAYREWMGTVYPKGAGPGQLLPIYAERLTAVEIASPRTPSPELLSAWAASVPPGFHFALKAPNRLGQEMVAGKALARAMIPFLDAAERLRRPPRAVVVAGAPWHQGGRHGDALGPMLVQVPPSIKADRHALSALLSALPEDLRVAFEFHHPSWHD